MRLKGSFFFCFFFFLFFFFPLSKESIFLGCVGGEKSRGP